MSNPEGPDRPDETAEEVAVGHAQEPQDGSGHGGDGTEVTEVLPRPDPEHEPTTEIMVPADPNAVDPVAEPGERRFTAPSGFDAGSTQIIRRTPDPATESFAVTDPSASPTEVFAAHKPAGPQLIPPRGEVPKPPGKRRSWGWVVAVVIIVAALAAIAVLGTLLLTRNSAPAMSQEDMVRSTIEDFDVAVQNGDLATLRSITCGATRDSYVRYDDKAWADTHARVAAAKQYPVVASIDQVVINGDHAEANVTTFMAFAPQTRSTRSFDLQFRDDHWKICQAPTG
ncbi:DUF4878 domain-containing protein [Mycobacterium sp. Y57]|uniref:Rv0361 family membrane protein n=1 Tax=Mycolicibacterium xanthum TaxID=2796469 RepID=UPI001C862045|nr:DUF4878 domain-containing protein [Mycolicibacterium xanthum]MBX7431945.1 DUF4878 domain-containing protein [Mycolicibacterium xanthum]